MNIAAFVQVELSKTKETKNMVRYDGPGQDEDTRRLGNVPNLYIRKTALAAAFSSFPEKIKVTIEVA